MVKQVLISLVEADFDSIKLNFGSEMILLHNKEQNTILPSKIIRVEF